MATISFREDLIIQSKKKSEDIILALQKPRDITIKPKQPSKLPKNAGSIWFKPSKK